MTGLDQRAHHRLKIPFRAVVSDRFGNDPKSCIIRDGSIAGCQIAVTNADELPEEICLKVSALREKISGKVVWRDEGRAGIAFEWSQSDEVGERRRAPRRRTLIPLQIHDAGRTASFAGFVANASRIGCQIEFDEMNELPDDVWLEIKGITGPIRGRVVWREKETAGIEFVWENDVYYLD